MCEGNTVTRSWYFRNFLVTKFLTKVAQIFGDLSATFKTAVSTFRGTFWKFCATFYFNIWSHYQWGRHCDHMELLCHFISKHCCDNFLGNFWKNCGIWSIFYKWAIPGLFFFYFRLFYAVYSKMFHMNFAGDWIRTADLWNQKSPLYQLSHNHYPIIWSIVIGSLLTFLFLSKNWFNQTSHCWLNQPLNENKLVFSLY